MGPLVAHADQLIIRSPGQRQSSLPFVVETGSPDVAADGTVTPSRKISVTITTDTTALHHDASPSTTDRNIAEFLPLPTPREMLDEQPLGDARGRLVERSREEIARILDGTDDRVLLVVGPCSVHDTDAARDYASRLAPIAARLSEDVLVVMRVYFEKPRTTVGWKGLINDPGLDESFDVPRGLRIARSLLLDVLDAGLPVGCEFLEPISPQYIADTVSWGAIGAAFLTTFIVTIVSGSYPAVKASRLDPIEALRYE